MPSPFPGMDPYLEDAAIWPGLHSRLINGYSELLQKPLLERGYYAEIGERIWLMEPGRNIYPDVNVVRFRDQPSNAAVVCLADEPIRVRRDLIQVTEPYLEIFDSKQRRLISGIELISPTNKTTSDGRKLYLRKQRDLRRGGVNLVEIDLTRFGRRVCDIPRGTLEGTAACDYLVNVVRSRAIDYEFYPIGIRSRLPRVRVPLKHGEPDLPLDLQEALDRAYDTGPYSVRVDYSSVCEPPLGESDAAWANELLKTKGLRG